MTSSIDPATDEKIQAFVNAPFGTMRVKTLRVGRVSFRDLEVIGREAANSLYNLVELACLRTQRNRVRRDGTRYIDLLPPGTPGRLLSEEIRDYLADQRRRKLKAATITSNERTLAILRMVTGDIEVSRIDYKHMTRMWELLRWAPANLVSDPQLKQKSVEALIQLGIDSHKPPLKDGTMGLHHRVLSAFFNHLVEHEAIKRSPMKGFKLPKTVVKKGRQALRLFLDTDLVRIFAQGSFVPWAASHPHRWWCPILTLYTGARIGEIAQLHLDDVIPDRSGGFSIQIHAIEDPDLVGNEVPSRMSVKGESAIRTVPLPAQVLAAGFEDFLADLKRHGHRRLFPHLSAGVNRKTGETNAHYAALVKREFGSYLKTLGFAKGVGFHAFRHTLATDLDDQGFQQAELALITGHAVTKVAPALADSYLHPGARQPEYRNRRKKRALKAYRPGVQVPVYQAGQFDKVLGPGNAFHP